MLYQRQEKPATVQVVGMNPAGSGDIRVIANPVELSQAMRVGQVRREGEESDRGFTVPGLFEDPAHHALVFFRRQRTGHIEEAAAWGQHAEGLSEECLLERGKAAKITPGCSTAPGHLTEPSLTRAGDIRQDPRIGHRLREGLGISHHRDDPRVGQP
jgi:hypothetical protein